MHVVIDLFGDEGVITIPPEKTAEEVKREENMRRRAIKEIFQRVPRLEILPITDL